MMDGPKPKRRFLRYSLRTMLVVVLVLSVWLGYMANKAAKQRRAVALVEAWGGSVMYDCEIRTTTTRRLVAGRMRRFTTQQVQPRPTGLLYDLLGIDWFHDVEQLYLTRIDISDQQLGVIVDGLPEVVTLILKDASLPNNQLEQLSALKRLESVSVMEPGATDKEIARLLRRFREVQVILAPILAQPGPAPAATNAPSPLNTPATP